MRRILAPVAIIAVGLLAAAAVTVILSGPGARVANTGDQQGFAVDYASLVLGVVIGLCLSTVAQWSWADLPRRFLMWVWANERNFFRFGTAGVLLGVILLY